MALNKAVLEASLESVFNSVSDVDINTLEGRKKLAKEIANAIYTFVKSGDVNVTVATTGTATAQTGTGTGKVT